LTLPEGAGIKILKMKLLRIWVIFTAFAPLFSSPGQAVNPLARLPGTQADGSVLLHNQWSIRPAGRQVQLLGTLPVNIAVHPKGRFAAVMDCGYGPHEVVVVDLDSGKITARATVSNSFYGIAFSANGNDLYCSGGGDEVVDRFDFRAGQITNDTKIPVHDRTLRAVPCGLAVNRAGTELFAANVWGNCVSEVFTGANARTIDFSVGRKPAHLAMAPTVPPEDFETFSADKRAEVGLYSSDPDDAFPYGCCLDEKRQLLYVSLWGQAAVKVIDLKPGGLMSGWSAEEHPCEMVLNRSGRILYVANANRNTVTVFDTATGLIRETIWAAFHPGDPPGSTPNSLALSPDQKTLFVANANVNAVAVFDVRQPGHSRSLGFIPTGWYPTSVRVTPDGKRLLVSNGKGGAPQANPRAPGPGGKKNKEYIASLFQGTLSIIDLPRGNDFEKQMAVWTAQVYANTPLKAGGAVVTTPPADSPIPAKPGDPSPIKYVIYIIKENRTYDQVLGDMPQGNGDAKLCLFPDRVTPNHHQLAREFVLLDNFYADASVSADGHEWSMGAYATDFVEKMWPMNYGHNHSGKFPYPAEGYFPIAAPAGGYLPDRAAATKVSYRSYGEFVSYDQAPGQPCRARIKSLEGHIDPLYRGFDLKYTDAKRVERYITEFKRLEAADDMPRLQIIRLPNDHTHGTTINFPAPSVYVADNDAALGQIVDLVSHSKYWPQTAIFVVEDDAQNGPDHVDAHRTVAFVMSPYVRHGTTDSTLYSTSSMLRTMELILGLEPMTQFDAAATPMFASFQATPDTRPYTALPETVNMNETNKPTAWGGNLKMDFSREDAADEFLLNEAVWKSVRGAASPMPAPVHAAFVFSRPEIDDD
jgi:DNA-binding beta-propeller fold protein YncE